MTRLNLSFFKKLGSVLAAVVLVISLLSFFSTFSTQKAEAGLAECAAGGAAAAASSATAAAAPTGLPVKSYSGDVLQTINNLTNSSQLAKECLLDPIAVIMREALIRKITSSIVTWINSGFEGSPAFVTNIDDFLLDTADEAFGTYIYNETNFAHLCSPFQTDIRFALALSYSSNPGRPACTLSDIADNVETAIDDLSVEWDWDVYETITTDPSGNIFSSYIQAQGAAADLINSEIAKKEQDIARGSGFLSYEKCEEVEDSNNYNVPTANEAASGQRKPITKCETVTPGSVIGETLTRSINLDLERIGLVDEFDEIVGALMGQLAQQAFSRDGVSGLTARSSGSDSFLNEYNQEARGFNNDTAGSLSNQAQDSTGIYNEYIAIQNESIQLLLQAKIALSEAQACYDSKYNTWVDLEGRVIAPADVDSVSDENKERATFTQADAEEPEQLTPEDSLLQVNEYTALLARIDSDLLQAESDIEQARSAAELAARYQSRLNTSGSAFETQELYAEYSSTIRNINVNPTIARAALDTIRAYTENAVEGFAESIVAGSPRLGGARQDLASCQTFNQVVDPS